MRAYYRLLTVLLIQLLLMINTSGCKTNKEKNDIPQTHISATIKPVIVKANKIIYLLPLGKISENTISTIYIQLKGYIPYVKRLPSEPLPEFAFYIPRKRYRADKLIQWMSNRAKAHEVYVGITTTDISATKNNIYDWGVMGLGYRPGKACIASSHRVKSKSNFYKIVLHEIGHTVGLDHCPVKSCFMRDAKGRDPTNEENEFCNNCKRVLVKNNWAL